MAKYITNSLEEGEKVVLNGRLHWTAIAGYLISAWLIVLAALAMMAWAWKEQRTDLLWVEGVLLVVAFVIYVVGCIVRTRSEFAVTTNRFIQKDGIFSISMTEIPLFKVETVNFHQTLLQRILGTGCIVLVGSGGTTHSIHSVEHPMQVRKTIVSMVGKTAGQSDAQEAIKD